MEDYESLVATTDMELLKRAWHNEKAAPEILRYESHLIFRVKEHIQLMEETVEDKSMSGGTDPLLVSLYQMDLDRSIFLLRSYLRIRIHKIQKHMFHILKIDELLKRLSKDERDYAKTCENDLNQHLEESVLSKLPKDYCSVSNMVPEPQLDTFVLCRSKEYLTVQLDDDDDRLMLFEMEPGVLHFMCYKSIKTLVESGKIDLL